MVGVAGRSKGCRTCRRRRVKCDEAHPVCNRCIKGNHHCEGYNRDLRFVDQTSTVQNKALRKYTSTSLSDSSSLDKAIIPCAASTLPLELDLRAFEDDVKITFMLTKLFSGITRFSPGVIRGWDAQSSNSVDKDTILAVSNVYFGRMHKQQRYMDQGSLHYCKALVGLCKDLQDPTKARDLRVLRTAMSLATYEFIASRSNNGWIQHAGGVERILEFRGPSAHIEDPERHVFISARMSIILRAMINRKRCFLDSTEWKTIPWSLDPSSKTMGDHIQDILVDIPAMMEDLTNLQRAPLSPTEFEAAQQSLIIHYEKLLTAMRTWRIWWEELYPTAAVEVPTSITTSRAPFKTIIFYTDLERANEISLYNATYLIIHELGTFLQFDSPSSPSSHFFPSSPSIPSFSSSSPLSSSPSPQVKSTNSPLLPPTLAHAPGQIALEICRSADYFLLKPHDSSGSLFLLFPLRMAFENLRGKEAELARDWMKVLMQEIADFSGFEVSRGLDTRDVET